MQINNLDKLERIDYNAPTKCEKCGCMRLKYKGVGEYKCEECGFFMYDDYGKVRNYIERNPGATSSEVSSVTGVSKDKIRHLLREDKIQIAPGSATFLHCERCGVEIRSGKYCNECQKKVSDGEKADKINARKSSVSGGFGKSIKGESGAKRFTR